MNSTGIEIDPQGESNLDKDDSPCPVTGSIRVTYSVPHLRLLEVELLSQTDHHNELVQVREWVLHPSERALSLRGNCFVIESVFDATGEVWIYQAPLQVLFARFEKQ